MVIDNEWMEEIKESVKHDTIHNDGLLISVSLKEMNWLISTVEEQQKEIERLQTIEQAYQAMKKSL